ncbi:MAG: flavin reductase [Clostridia bacterium]|nr:flavin reductase [Clostridia bacterium]MCR4904715.1 flavin reductase [Clostridiales bacterium]
MNGFRSIRPEELCGNVFRLIGHDWMLVTSANDGEGLVCGKDYNTMTASWGGMGILWGGPVAFVFIRPQRHTFGFTERNERLTLSFFGEEYRAALNFCGSKSGRDVDKAKECGLNPAADTNEHGRAVWFEEAKLVLKTRKLYAEPIKAEAFLDPDARAVYPKDDFHTVYVCAVEEVLVRD